MLKKYFLTFKKSLELYKLSKKFTEGNARYLWAFLRIWRHTFSRLSINFRHISNQLACSHKTVGSHLKLTINISCRRAWLP